MKFFNPEDFRSADSMPFTLIHRAADLANAKIEKEGVIHKEYFEGNMRHRHILIYLEEKIEQGNTKRIL